MMISPILAVHDVDATVDFYTRKLGFEYEFSLPGSDGTSCYALVRLGDSTIGLGREINMKPLDDQIVLKIYMPNGITLEDYYKRVRASGVEIDGKVHDEIWGDRTFSIYDPNGYYLTFAQRVERVPMWAIAAAMRGVYPFPSVE